MRWKARDLPIATKVALAPAIVLVFLLALAVIGRLLQDNAAQALQQLSGQSLPEAAAAARLKWRTANLESMVLRSLAYEGAGMKAKRIKELDDSIAKEFDAFAADLAKAKAAANELDRPRYTQIEELLKLFRRLALETLDAKSGGLSAAAMLMTSAEAEYKKFEKAVDGLVGAIHERGQTSAADSLANMSRGAMSALAMVALAVAVSVLAIWLCVRLITQPLREAVRIAQRVAEGDLTVDVRSDRLDETGQVLQALAQVSERLGGLMANVQVAASRIENASTEIAAANGDLSQRTEQTALSLQQTTDTMRALAGQTASNGRSAAHACQLASQAADIARRGGAQVGEVVEAMSLISSQAQRIRDIIGVIDGIAFQTNILALNAAVEAARAGEQGRGFAVVAQEVRALASRSGESAKEIRSLIGTSVEQVESGSSRVQTASATMQSVVESVNEIERIVSDMANAGTEQSRGVEEVNRALGAMDQVTQQNAAMVEQGAAATLSLREQTEGLVQALSVFRLNGAPATR